MAGFLQRFYRHVYINVLIESSYCDIFTQIEKRGRVEEQLLERFVLEKGEITKAVIDYIELQERKSPYSYISLLSTDTKQGARPGCAKEGILDQLLLCQESGQKRWAVFADTTAIASIQQRFRHCGIDFIFSPFLLLPRIFRNVGQAEAQMFILSLEESLSVAVFKSGQLIFGKQISLSEGDEFSADDLEHELLLDDEDETDLTNLDMDINLEGEGEHLESLDVLDDLDALDELDEEEEIQPLDALEHGDELVEFEEGDMEAPLEEQPLEAVEMSLSREDHDLGGLSKNYQRFEVISSVIHDFYREEDIESSFIEKIYIASKLKDHEELKGYLKDELFVEVTLESAELFARFTDLVKEASRHCA